MTEQMIVDISQRAAVDTRDGPHRPRGAPPPRIWARIRLRKRF